jgi:hypothetical protein
MVGIPRDIDLSKIIGQFTTQIRIGKYDFQFDLGDVSFCLYSPIKVLKDEQLHATWKEGSWPDSGFLEIFNVPVSGFEIPDDRTIIIEFENSLEMYLIDKSNGYESMNIWVKGGLGRRRRKWTI